MIRTMLYIAICAWIVAFAFPYVLKGCKSIVALISKGRSCKNEESSHDEENNKKSSC